MQQSTAKALKILPVLLGAVLLVWLMVSLWSVIVPFFFAVLFAYILQPVVDFLLRKKLPVGLAILLTYLALIGLLYLLVFWCVPAVLDQMEGLLQYLPQVLESTELWWQEFQSSVERVNLPEVVQTAITEALAGLGAYAAGFVEGAALKLVGFVRYTVYLILAPVLSYYMLRDQELFKKQLIAFLPPGERPEILRIAGDVNHLLRQFLYGYLLVSLIVAVLTGLFLWAVGVDYAVLMGILMGVADLIPYFGPILAAVPIVFLAFLQSPQLALYTIIGMVVIQQLEGNIITPKIMGDRIGLHPLATIFVVLAGGYWFGLLGSVLAVPVSAALLLILRYIYSRLVAYPE